MRDMHSWAQVLVRQGMDRWAQSPDDDDSPVPYVERSVQLLHTLFAS
jgi:hypothetical protein